MGCTASKDKEDQEDRIKRLEVQLHYLQSDVQASIESEISTIEAALAKLSAAEPEVRSFPCTRPLRQFDRLALFSLID